MTTVDAHAPGTPIVIDLLTPDPEAARNFYGALFRWSFEIGPPESGPYSMCRIGERNAAGIGPKPPDAPWPAAWHVYFATADADSAAAKIVELGGKVMMGPSDVFEQGRMLVAADSVGAMFGLWQPKLHTGARVSGEHGAMTWHEVNTRDPEAARVFYTALFGLEARELPMPDAKYFTLHHGEQAIGGILEMHQQWPQQIPAHWMNYFAVEHCDTAAHDVEKLGGTLKEKPFDSPYGRIAVAADPFGAIFSIIELSPQAPG
jgi:predicted enzyme related to lactoylglutathione lyase